MTRKLKADKFPRLNRQPKKTIFISCEGQTEKYYFENLGLDFKTVITVKIEDAKGSTASNVVQNAINKAHKDYDIVYCVFDAENINGEKQKDINDAVKLAKEKGYQVLFSAPCFEAWFLMHFNLRTPLHNGREAKDKFKKILKDKNLDSEKINKEKCFNHFYKTYLRLNSEIACDIAEALDEQHNKDYSKYDVKRNPSSTVYKLIDEIKPEK